MFCFDKEWKNECVLNISEVEQDVASSLIRKHRWSTGVVARGLGILLKGEWISDTSQCSCTVNYYFNGPEFQWIIICLETTWKPAVILSKTLESGKKDSDHFGAKILYYRFDFNGFVSLWSPHDPILNENRLADLKLILFIQNSESGKRIWIGSFWSQNADLIRWCIDSKLIDLWNLIFSNELVSGSPNRSNK